MAVSIPEARQARDMIVKEYKVKESVAWDFLCKLYDGGTGEKKLREILDGNLENVPDQAKQYGIEIIKRNKNAENLKAYKARQKEKRKEVENILKDQTPERITAEIVENLPHGELPEDIGQQIDDCLAFQCEKFNIEDIRKAPATVWRSLCMGIGFMFRKSELLRDKQREAHEGGKIYDPERVGKLIDIWAYLCGNYDKAPLAADFIAFTGIDDSWFYKPNVTPTTREIMQKLRLLQESGISSALVDGRRNPTGAIFFLKNWHGWRDQREIVHTDTTTIAPTMYPTFKPIENAPQITKNGDL